MTQNFVKNVIIYAFIASPRRANQWREIATGSTQTVDAFSLAFCVPREAITSLTLMDALYYKILLFLIFRTTTESVLSGMKTRSVYLNTKISSQKATCIFINRFDHKRINYNIEE